MSRQFIESNAEYFFRAGTDFLFRRRHPGTIMLRIASALLLGLLAGMAFNISIPTGSGTFAFSFSNGETPNWLYIGVFGVAVVAFGIGIIWTSRALAAEGRKRVYAIELRGLRDTSGCPLYKAIPSSLEGRRDQLLINLRQGQDGHISEPTAAIRKIAALPHDLETREQGIDRSDISYVLGGLAPVPLSFLTGVLTDDECAVIFMDWNRHHDRWSALDAVDDGKRFVIDGLDIVPSQAPDVALAISVSYDVDLAGVELKLPNIPLVEMRLEDGTPDAHWSNEKQAAMGQQFLETLIKLSNLGVGTIHLFMAAQNSIVLRFGRLYDKRNLPPIIVYQYERSQTPPFVWGIRMPVAGTPDATVVN